MGSELNQLNIDPVTGIAEAGIEGIGGSKTWLQNKLRSSEVVVHGSSGLGQSWGALGKLIGYSQSSDVVRFAHAHEAHQLYSLGNGADFLSKALHRGWLAGLRGFEKHFRALASANPVTTAPEGKSTLERNLSWELVLASLVATFATNVEANEPDVTCLFGGRRVGLAAKVLYSAKHASHLKTIKDGAEQLESSGADEGFVLINMVELFPHRRMFDNFRHGRVTTNADAVQIMDVWTSAFMSAYDIDAWARRLKGMNKLLSVMFFLPALLHAHGIPNPLVPYYRIHLVSIDGREERARAFEWQLNAACQTVLSFRASAPSA